MLNYPIVRSGIALFAILLLVTELRSTALAGPIAVTGTVDNLGTVTPNGTALSNPPGDGETRGVFEVDLDQLRSVVPGAELGDASVILSGVRFDVAKTARIFTYYGADMQLTASDFNPADGTRLSFSQQVPEPTGPEGIVLQHDLAASLFLNRSTIGFSLQESESSGNFIISVEMLFIAIILIAGIIGGLAAIHVPATPQFDPNGLPNGKFVFGSPEFTFTSVPESSTLVLVLVGLAFAVAIFWHRRRLRTSLL